MTESEALSLLEDIARNGRSEIARLQALKLLLAASREKPQALREFESLAQQIAEKNGA